MYVLPELSYDLTALEPHLSARVLEIHHDRHHRGYVAKANETLALLEHARAEDVWPDVVGLEKSLAFNVSGHVLHSLYWASMGPDRGGKPEGELAAAIDDSFGSFEGFSSQWGRVAAGVQGSGWAALVWEPTGRRLLITQVENHQANIVAGADLLMAVDVWEHAYYLQYENRRGDYLDAMWNVYDWVAVGRRLASST